jgi:hypothetical protein
MLQAVSGCPVAADEWIRPQLSPCGNCGEHSGTEIGFCPSIAVVSFHKCSISIHSFIIVLFPSPSLFFVLTVGVEVVYFHLITLRHIPQSVGLLWKRDRPVSETSTSQHKHCTRDKHPCPPVGFESTIPASARP